MRPEALRLYLVSGPRPSAELLPLIQAGVTMVQLRDKAASGRALLDVAQAWLEVLRPAGVPLIINDRADVAAAADADGVHLGQSDLPVAAARHLLGPDRIIGLSLETADAEADGADYVAASPVFATPTKSDTAAPLGLEGLARLARRLSTPLVGIGGIDADRARRVIQAGAAGVAVVSAILDAPEPSEAARVLRAAVEAGLEAHPTPSEAEPPGRPMTRPEADRTS